jgi:alkylation response protein AidB-like acyl-CoA dehydrogenase
VSLLLIERGPGVSTKRIKTSYTSLAGTTYVEFKNVKVPVENLLGEENKGFKCVMANFNTERWGMAVAQVALNRLIIEECYRYDILS